MAFPDLEEIVEACRAHVAGGGRVERGAFYRQSGRVVCALGAVCLARVGGVPYFAYLVASRLASSETEVSQFVLGFDGYPPPITPSGSGEAYDLGRAVYSELVSSGVVEE